jgi:hypothetical protein
MNPLRLVLIPFVAIALLTIFGCHKHSAKTSRSAPASVQPQPVAPAPAPKAAQPAPADIQKQIEELKLMQKRAAEKAKTEANQPQAPKP